MKKKTAKLLCLTMSIVLVLGMAACGSKKEEPETEENPYDLVDSAGNPGMDPIASPSGVEDPGPDDPYIDEDMVPDGVVFPDSSMFSDWSEEMAAIREAVSNELEGEYWPQMQMDADYLEMTFGLTRDMYDDFMGEMPLMSAHVDTLLVVKAKDGQADAVEQALEDYRQKVLDNSMQYPMNVAKSQACKVARNGNYVSFVLLGGDITAYEEEGDEAIIAHCQKVNDRVIEIISENIRQ